MSRRSTRNAGGPAESASLAPSVQAHLIPSGAATPMSSSIYLQNYYSHPASTRLLLGNISQNNSKGYHAVGGAVPKPPKPPEKPLMPYMRYSRKVWEDVKAGNPELKLWEIGKIIGQMWRELPQSDRQQYVEEYEVDKMGHLEQLKLYHNSPQYQAYVHAKTRAEAMEASAEALGGDKDDAYMSIEPTDEAADDSDMCFSVKHVAAARFQRNHRLINDILGETIHVPSTRAVVTTQRLNVLKNQVQSLELHQKKLEAELVHLEDAHTQKKRKLITQAREFEKEIKRLREITPQDYYKEYKIKQQQAQQKQEEEAKAEKEAKESKEGTSQPQEDKESEKKDAQDQEVSGEKTEEKKTESTETTDASKEEQNDETKDSESQVTEQMEVEESESKAEKSTDKPEIKEETKPEDETGSPEEESSDTETKPEEEKEQDNANADKTENPEVQDKE